MSDNLQKPAHIDSHDGIARVTWHQAQGMVSLRGNLQDEGFTKAVETAWGIAVPAPLTWNAKGNEALAWMSPDELLLFCAYEDADARTAALQTAAQEQHFLAVTVSDARAVFSVEGEHARDVLAKLTPADLRTASFNEMAFRRTRLAQIPAGIGLKDGVFTVMCFRSVAQYGFDLLKTSAENGSEVGFHGQLAAASS